MKYPTGNKPKVVKNIPPEIKGKPYIVLNEDNVYTPDEDPISVSVIVDNKTKFNFEFELKEIPYCCGVVELGNFHAQNSRDFYLEDKYKVEAVKKLILSTFNGIGGRSIIINTVRNNYCDLVVKAIEDGKYFTNVKTFTNANSGNVVRMWISNNK